MINLFRVAMHPSASEMVRQVLQSGYIGQGPKVKEFEQKLSTFFVKPTLTTNSCTSALDLALHLCDVNGPEDLVLTTPLTCTATNGVIVRRGAIPVWIDVDEDGLIDPEEVEFVVDRLKRIGLRPKAIMAVDWGGKYCDYIGLRRFEIPIIRDAAHCFNPDLSLGADFTCLSFQAIKFLTTGDGGALICRSDDDYKRAKLLRWYGLDRESSADFRCDQNIQEVGYKYHMNDIAAAIGLANFDLAKENVEKHRRNAKFLGAPDLGDYWVFFIRVSKRSEFQEFMRTRGIVTSLVHKRNDWHDGFRFGRTYRLDKLAVYDQEYVAVPCGWWLTEENLQTIKDALDDWRSEHSLFT